MTTLTLLWIRCPSAGAEDSLNISVQYHYETEIVFAHSSCQASSCLDKKKIFNNEKRKVHTVTSSIPAGHLSLDTVCLQL